MTSATIRPTMTDLGVISRMCGGLTDGGGHELLSREQYAGVRGV